jgi:hypothetical protein
MSDLPENPGQKSDPTQRTAAPQPSTDPGSKPKKCDPLTPAPKTPEVPEPKKCPPPASCNCPSDPGATASDCLENLIKSQAKLIKEADSAKDFVDELTEQQKKAAAAKLEYTQAKYKDLVQMWKDQDKAIADLIKTLVCAVRCWSCLLECRLCPLLYEIRALEIRLNGTGELTNKVFSLRDLECWQERNRDARQAVFDRIGAVMAAWESPAKTLADALEKNGNLIKETLKIVASDPATAVYDVFMRIVPLHWAIRPRKKSSNAPEAKYVMDGTSAIDPKYIDICKCYDNPADDCCGPDAGEMKLRDRLVGPQPFLVDPGEYLEIICCLATERYHPAKDMLAAAEGDLAGTKAEIERTTQLIKDKTDSIADRFKAELGNPIDCEKYEPKDGAECPPATDGNGNGGASQTPTTEMSD